MADRQDHPEEHLDDERVDDIPGDEIDDAPIQDVDDSNHAAVADADADADEPAVADEGFVAALPADPAKEPETADQSDSADLPLPEDHTPNESTPADEPDEPIRADGDTETQTPTGEELEDDSADDPSTESLAESSAESPSDSTAESTGESTDEDGPPERSEEDADADVETLEAPVGLGEPEVTTERVVESVLFASDAPLPLSKIVSIVGVGSARDVRNHIKALNEKYEQTGATFRIEQIASGYQMLTLPVYNTWIRRLKQTKQDSRLSQAALETLAVVAYKQPVVRADIEAIRGVSAGEMLNRLRELGLIKIVGRAEDVGRPMLYGTTRRFLEVFGLSSLEDLPSVEEMQPGE